MPKFQIKNLVKISNSLCFCLPIIFCWRVTVMKVNLVYETRDIRHSKHISAFEKIIGS